MLIKDLKDQQEIISDDNCYLKELLSPNNDDVDIHYSLAHARVSPGEITYPHRLKKTEIYYILDGEGEMHINDETKNVTSGQVICIPPHGVQYIKNIGKNDLIFLCIVDPAWQSGDDELL